MTHPATPHLEVGPEFDGLRHAVHQRIAPILRNAGLEDHEIGVDITGSVGGLHILLSGPPEAASVRSALSVRVLDAVHHDGRTFGRVDVEYHFGAAAA